MKVVSFMDSSSLTIHSNTADNWRVILKADRPDYINASFANVNKCAFSLDCTMKCIMCQRGANAIFIISSTAGLQAVQGVHHCTGPNERHLSWFLEGGVWEGVWGDCDAIRPCGGWRGTLGIYICITFSCLTSEKPYPSSVVIPSVLSSHKHVGLRSSAVSDKNIMCVCAGWKAEPLAFWRCSCHGVTTIIVMPQEVCHQYWCGTSGEKGTEMYGEFSVATLETLNQDGFVERHFSISDPKVRKYCHASEAQ